MADSDSVPAPYMTGPEHYRKAQALLREVDRLDVGDEVIPEVTALAQVHAILALAAATATGAIAYVVAEGGTVETGPGTWQDVLSGGAA